MAPGGAETFQDLFFVHRGQRLGRGVCRVVGVGSGSTRPRASLRRALPGDDADELTWLLFRQEDVISLEQVLQHLSRKAVRHRVASGRWRQVHPAVFVTHNGPVGIAQLWWIAVLAAGPAAVLGGLTAAQAGGLRGFPDRVVHLLLPASCRRGPLPQGVLAHRTTHLPARDVLAVGQPPRTMAAARSSMPPSGQPAMGRLGRSLRLPSNSGWWVAMTCIRFSTRCRESGAAG